jgi:hypothetical protein
VTSPSTSERRRLAVSLCGCHEFGIERIARFASGLSALSILPTFLFDPLCAILRAGTPASGHHRGAIPTAGIHK